MISVIMPVYNAEKYLSTSINSILNQTFHDFELILVDDGSTDNSPKICDDYAFKNDKIFTIHKKNAGPSDARNEGVKVAKGSFVTFIDSDDHVSKDYLEMLVYLLQKHKADISAVGIEVCYKNKETKSKVKEFEYVYSGLEALENMLYQKTLDSSPCAMLIPMEIVKNNPFPLGKFHEDDYTTYKYFLSAKRVAVTTEPKYFYLQREGSIMHTFGQASIDELDAADNYVNFCKEFYPNLVPAAESKKFSDYCQVLLSNKDIKKTNKKEYLRICKYINESKVNIFKNKKCRPKNRIAALLSIFNIKILVIVNEIIKV